MNPSWTNGLSAAGAQIAHGVVTDFGDVDAERAATQSGSIVAPLDAFGVLSFSGADAGPFLHGQLSCDVQGLPPDRSTYGSFSTAKGRMLATFLLWRVADGYRMLLDRSILPGVQKRLQMFVLRARVKIADRTADEIAIGASGPEAPAAVARACGPAPSNRHDASAFSDGQVLRVPGGRFIVVVEAERAPQVWGVLASSLRPVGMRCWLWLEIVNGVPFINAATQDHLVPQMANLELLGGVSFKKGCYPGQEIVARTQYLGKLKRRMFLAHVSGETLPAAGDALFSDDTGDQANGLIVAAAPSPQGGSDCLAVVQIASAEGSRVHLGGLAGPVLEFRALPYSVA